MNGLVALAAAISIFSSFGSSIAEGLVCSKAMEGISRNPEAFDKIRSTMILGVALCETCAIYALLISLLLLFVTK